MKKYCVFLFLTAVVFLNVTGQGKPKISKKHFVTTDKVQTKENLNKLSKANKYYKKGIYDESFKLYEQLYSNESSNEALNYKLGMSALKEYYSNESLKFLLESSSFVSKDYYLRLGEAYQLNHKYEEAYRSYDSYNESLSTRGKRKFAEDFAQLRDECRFGIKAVEDSLPYFITNLGASVNSYYDEYSPVLVDGSNILYYTTRQPEKSTNKKLNRKSTEEKIKKTNFNIEGNTNAVFDAKLNKKGNVSIAGKNNETGDIFKKQLGKIYAVRVRGNRVGKKLVRGSVNRKTTHISSLSVSKTGEAAFISDKNKFRNGYDLFLAGDASRARVSRGYAAPETINTKFDERSVSFSADGKTMFFSSNGHNGFGGYDIYKVEKRSDGTWSDPINLGYPINSAADEMFYHPTSNPDVAIIASNRQGSFGGLDLFQVVKDNRIPFSIWGDVSDIENNKAVVSKVSIIDRSTNETLADAESNELSGEYSISLEDVGDYLIQVEADGYLVATDYIEMPHVRHSQIRKDFQLTRLASPFTFYGNVANAASNDPIVGEVVVKSLEKDSIIGRSLTRSTDGGYSITVGDKYNVIITASANNFFSKADTFMLRDSSDDKFENNFRLVRSKIDYIVTGLIKDAEDQTPIAASLAFFEPGAENSIYTLNADTISGKYVATLDEQGPFILEVNAEGYFFANLPIVFTGDSTLIIRDVELQKMSKGTKIVVENILFDTGKATLLSQSFVELNKLGKLLLENKDIRIEVSGHTDNTGSASVNKRLSRNRAESVRNYLIEQGVDGMRLQFEGYGFDRPIESNDTPQGRAANRRVEIEVIE